MPTIATIHAALTPLLFGFCFVIIVGTWGLIHRP